jgi:hypothetical protein
MRVAEFQAGMCAALLEPALDARDAELGIATTDPTARYRIAIHHRHFWTRMRDFAAYRYPLVARFLGDDDFGSLVRQYIAARASVPFAAASVVSELVTFVGTASPWASWPIVRELAAFDFQRSSLRLQREELTTTAFELAALDNDALPHLKLRLKRRATAITTRYAFSANPLDRITLDTPLDDEPTRWLLHFTHRRLIANPIAPREYDALRLLIDGCTIEELIREMSRCCTTPELDAYLDRWLRAELLVAIEA